MAAVNLILTDPAVWKDIAPKGVKPCALYEQEVPDALYFLVNEGDGVIIFHPFRESCKIHPNFLPEKRGGLAYRAIQESVQKIFSYGYTSIYAEIEPKLRHVTMTARALGFKLLEKGERNLYVRRRLDT